MRVDADSCGNIRPVDGEDRQDLLFFFEIQWHFFLAKKKPKRQTQVVHAGRVWEAECYSRIGVSTEV